MERKDGYIMLSRKFFTNDMWTASRAYSECEAWLDLIQSARFEASETTSRVGIHDITWGRGQYPAATSFLSKRWKWSDQNVKTFLKKLKRNGMVITDNSQGVNVITLCKYDDYNPVKKDANQSCNQLPNQLNGLTINELQELLTRVLTNELTNPSPDPNHNKNKANKEKEENIILSNDNTSGNSSELPDDSSEYDVGYRIPFQKIIEMWNTTCTGYQQVLKLGDKRKNKIRIRIDEMGGIDKAISILHNLFEKMQYSNFLRGESARGWKANFDWIFANGENWVKVLECRYDNDKNKNSVNDGTIKTNVGIDTDDAKAKRDRDFAEHIRTKLGGGD